MVVSMRVSIVRSLFLLVLLSCFAISSPAQVPVKVMQYNILRYGAAGIGGCTPTGVTARNAWLTAIMTHAMPDIFGVNEIGPLEGPTAPATNILNNILKPLNPAYERAIVTTNGTQDVGNAFFYNSAKLGLHSQAVIPHSLRNIDYYKMYYKGPGLAVGDTTWLEFVVVHLHASEAATRSAQTSAIMNYLCGFNRPGNFIVMGDFNVDGSSETSYQNLVANPDTDCKMNDPINLNGTWANNNNARHAWTQSTRSSSGSDCGSGGGLDDRFDFILCSNAIKNNTQDIGYVPSSYHVIGNPNSPNPAVPSGVTAALAPMSDHFPVMLTLEISQAVSVDDALETSTIQFLNHPAGDFLEIDMQVQTHEEGNWTLKMVDLMGRSVSENQTQFMPQGKQRISLATSQLPTGLYLLQMEGPGGSSIAKPFWVNH